MHQPGLSGAAPNFTAAIAYTVDARKRPGAEAIAQGRIEAGPSTLARRCRTPSQQEKMPRTARIRLQRRLTVVGIADATSIHIHLLPEQPRPSRRAPG